MSYTATKVELTNDTGFPRRFTCADGVAIPIGSLLTLTDPRTAAAVSDSAAGAGYFCCGIANTAKEASDGQTSIGAWTDGVFEMAASGSITAGNPVKSCGAGKVMVLSAADVGASMGLMCGIALETASDGEVINVRFRV